jgi:hypothetical protein
MLHFMCSTCFYTEGKLRRSNWTYDLKNVKSVIPADPEKDEQHYCCWCGQVDNCVEVECDFKRCEAGDLHEKL